MAYVPELGRWVPARYLLTQLLLGLVPQIKPTYGLKQARDVLDHAGALVPSYLDRDQPNIAEHIAKRWDAQPFITFGNGDLHVPSMTLMSHNPEHRTTWGVPFDWNPHVTSAKLDQFLQSAVPDDVGRKNLLSFLGYALARYDTSQHMFVYLLGTGSNGKSLLLKLIRSPREGTITVKDGIPADHQFKTLFHEWSHSLGVKTVDEAASRHRGLEEIVAETTAFVVAGSLGLDTSEYSRGYIGHWAQGDQKIVAQATNAIGQRVHAIVQAVEKAAAKDPEIKRLIAHWEPVSLAPEPVVDRVAGGRSR